jgi:hypothetical protein
LRRVGDGDPRSQGAVVCALESYVFVVGLARTSCVTGKVGLGGVGDRDRDRDFSCA